MNKNGECGIKKNTLVPIKSAGQGYFLRGGKQRNILNLS